MPRRKSSTSGASTSTTATRAFAPAYTIGNARVGFAQVPATPESREYVRVNNIANVNYIGSVIVGDTNGRYFEPAPGRNWFAGVSVNVVF